jgi:hypothetical protein
MNYELLFSLLGQSGLIYITSKILKDSQTFYVSRFCNEEGDSVFIEVFNKDKIFINMDINGSQIIFRDINEEQIFFLIQKTIPKIIINNKFYDRSV